MVYVTTERRGGMSIPFHFLVTLGFGLLISCTDKKSIETTDGEKTVQTTVGEEQDTRDKVILFFGNSLTAGYGIEPSQAFPALIQDIIDSLQLNYRVVNAGLSGETTASGKNRVQWVLKQQVDVFVLELGGNDGLRGISPEETRRNLEEIIRLVRQQNPQTMVVLAGMQIPPNMGERYSRQFRSIFPEVADQENVVLIPFLLEGVGGEKELNQPDGIHPTAEGHQIVAQTIWSVIGPEL